MQKHFGENIALLFLAGLLAVNYPILSLFDHAVLVFGIPLLYLYLFVAWAGVIGLLARIMEGRPSGDGTEGED